MEKKKLDKLRSDVSEYFKRYTANGGKITTYTCSYCNADLQTPQAKKSLVGSKGYWDSCKTCTECGRVNFVQTWPTGRTKTVSLEKAFA